MFCVAKWVWASPLTVLVETLTKIRWKAWNRENAFLDFFVLKDFLLEEK